MGYCDESRDLQDSTILQPVVPDELRRAIWLSKAPGRSSEEKIWNLLGFYNASGEIDYTEEAGAGTEEAFEQLFTLSVGYLSFTVDVICLDCETAGYVEMAVMPDGWYMESRLMCPECDGDRVIIADFRIRKDAGL